MERLINEEESLKIINLGALGYDIESCSIVLGFNVLDVNKKEFDKLYNAGRVKSDFVIDMKLFELAQSGDVRALQELDKRKLLRERKYQKEQKNAKK